MLRAVAAAILLLCLPVFSFAQTPSGAPSAAKRSTAKPRSQSAAVAAEAGHCHIGVIPIAGTLFLVEDYGMTRFGDKAARVSVESWALDDLVVSRVRAAVPGLSVRRVPFTKEDLARHPRSFSLFTRDDNIRSFAQTVAAGMNCDRYVLVHRHGGVQPEFGIGISRHYGVEPVFLFAMMYIRVYDGHTFELISKAAALDTEDTLAERFRHGGFVGPFLKLDAAKFPAKPTDVAANPLFRDGVRALLTAGLDKTLPPMLRP